MNNYQVINKNAPAWVRIKMNNNQTGSKYVGFDFPNKNFKKKGEYWYYTKPLQNKEELLVIDKLMISHKLKNAVEDLSVVGEVEAIQARNFTPDFEIDEPWRGLTGKKAPIKQNLSIKETKKPKFVYYGGAEKYLIVPDDFFSNFKDLMPGDELTDAIDILNTSDSATKIYLSFSPLKNEFNEHIYIKIDCNGVVLFEGTLADSFEKRLLGTFEPKETAKINCTVRVSPDLDNDFADQNLSAMWCFESEETTQFERVLSRVKTGDSFLVGKRCFLFTANVILIILLCKYKKKEDGDELEN